MTLQTITEKACIRKSIAAGKKDSLLPIVRAVDHIFQLNRNPLKDSKEREEVSSSADLLHSI